MTGFNFADFDRLFELSGTTFEFNRRGKKTQVSPRDTLILLLNYVRRYPKIEEMAVGYQIKPSTLGKLLMKAIHAATGCWQRLFITEPGLNLTLPTDDNFPNAGFIVDATVQQINKPAGTFEERKPWFSGKHNIYCLKSQVISDLKGTAIHITTSIKGATHDLAIFKMSLPELDMIIDHHTNGQDKVLADKGYQCGEIKCLITPHKGKVDDLSRPQLQFNDRHSKSRVVIENYFGRLKSKFAITANKYRGDHEHYEDIFILCCALVNYDIRQCNHGLRRDDGEFYKRMLCQEKQDREINERRKQEAKKTQRDDRMRRIFGE
jgi:hypothetical protein